jgi:hypothetical protein
VGNDEQALKARLNLEMNRAFSASLLSSLVPGAMPQAGDDAAPLALKRSYAGMRRSLPKKRAVHERQMPWLIFGAPGLMTCLHQAHIRVGRRRTTLIAFFMIGKFDERETQTFKERIRNAKCGIQG